MGLEDDATLPHQMDNSEWPAMKEKFKEIFKTKTRDEWSAIFGGTDACVFSPFFLVSCLFFPFLFLFF